MNVLADEYHDTDWEITDHQWRENTNITLDECNLVIKNGGILTFNNSVVLKILCPNPGDYGVIIESGGKFEINCNNGNTKITYGSVDPEDTYTFTNSGTVDFLGATVDRVYGNPTDKTNTGGIRNMPGSVCKLDNCNIVDADTHSVYAEGNATESVELQIANCVIANTTSSLLDGSGIYVKGNANVMIDGVTIKNVKEHGIGISGASNVTVKGNTVIKRPEWSGVDILNSDGIVLEDLEIRDCKEYGVIMENSVASISNVRIHDNTYGGIVGFSNSEFTVEGCTVTGNGDFGILAYDSIPVIRNNPLIGYNANGIYIYEVWNQGAEIYNNTISNNVGIGIIAEYTDITIRDNQIISNGMESKFYDSFELDRGWTTDGMWHRVNSGDVDAPEWNISYNGDWSYWYGQDSTGDFDNGTRNWGNLTSPVIDVTGTNDAYVTFMSWSDVNETSGDERWVQARNNGGDWENLLMIDGDDMGRWVRHTVDVSHLVPTYTLEIRFFFDTITANDNANQGWYIDAVSVLYNRLENRTNGILVSDSRPHIHDNHFHKNDYGIYGINQSSPVIENNTFDENEIAIKGEYSNFTIKYNQIFNQTSRGIYLIGSEESTLFHNDIWDNRGYAIYSEGSAIEIFDCNITNNYEGIYLVDGSEALVHNNIIVDNCLLGNHGSNPKATGVHIDNSAGTVHSNLMIDNKISVYSYQSSGSIYNNTIVEEPVPEGFHPIFITAVEIRESYNLSISENWIASWTYNDCGMINIEDSDTNIIVDNNTLEGQFEGSLAFNFRENWVYYDDLSVAIGVGGSGASGIRTRNSSTAIRDNNINGTYWQGIKLSDASYAEVSNNIVTESIANGIHVENSYADILSNRVSNNLNAGLYASQSGTYTENSQFDGNLYGIYLSYPEDTVIENNNIGTISPIINETIYGPSIGDGNDANQMLLAHDNILDCTIYIDLNGTEWYKMDEQYDYDLNYETGLITIDWGEYMEENWYFYAFYNCSDEGNGFGIYYWSNGYMNAYSLEIINNTVKGNSEYGIYAILDVPQVYNETVYGPSIGNGNDPATINLAHENIINCTLYIDLNGTEWYKLDEQNEEYELDYATGQIYIEWYEYIEENWTFYAYYNYSSVLESEPSPIILIEGNQIMSNLKDGVKAFNCNLTMVDNYIFENVGAGVHLSYCMGEILDSTISRNRRTYGGGGPPQMSGIDLLWCADVRISGNDFFENQVNIYLENSREIVIDDNDIEDETAVLFGGALVPRGIYSIASQMIVSNNTIWGTCVGIDIEDADEYTVLINNTFYPIEAQTPSSGAEIGVKLTRASPVIENNTFDGIRKGIVGYDNSSAYIYNNTIINCSNDGIYLEWSEATIIGNNITGNGGWGIISKYAAPSNSGTNGTGLTSDNPLLGDNDLGMATQLWQLRILVLNGTTMDPISYTSVQINDQNNNTVWSGYTDWAGYTETVIISQYEITYTNTYIFTPFRIYTEGTLTIANVEGNKLVTVYI
jgi:parallel beta-helix repeat protein